MSSRLDVVRARLVLRHRPVTDLLDLALRFVVVHAAAYATVSLVALLPGVVLSVLVGRSGGWWWGWLVAVAWTLLAQVPFTVLASRLVFEDDVRARDVLTTAIKNLPRVVALRTIVVVLTALAGLMFFVPAVWVAAIYAFSTEVLLLERAGIVLALSRAPRLAQSDVAEALVGVLLAVVVPLLAVLLTEVGGRSIISDLLQFRPPAALWDEGGSVLAVLGLFVAVPYVATARFFIYLNVRTHVEGWDIQTRFASLTARSDEAVTEAA